MELNKAAIGVLAAVCVTAGAGGAYLATRSGDSPSTTNDIAVTAVSPDPAANAVEQSEAVIAETSAAPAPPAARSQQPSVAERRPAIRPSTPERAARPAAEPPARVNAPVEPPAVPEPRAAETPVTEAPRAAEIVPAPRVEPPAPQFEELIVSADSVIGLQVETSISSERARVEDEVVAQVTRDVRVGDRVAIPAGSKARGEVTLVERGGRVRDRARLGIRFTSVVLADGTRIPLETETIYREGEAPGGESAAKIGGGAIGGAIIGGILGGAKGAVIGGSVGAGAGTTAVLAGGRNAATLSSGTPITVRLAKPATVTVEK
jgi:type IV secretory pathway VirB10-like protein